MKNNKMLEYIYNKYYENFTHYSDVTSSHWRNVGMQWVKKINGQYTISGIGFGNFIERTVKNRIFHMPETIMSLKLLEKYKIPNRYIQVLRKIALDQQRWEDFDCVKQLLSLQTIFECLGFSLNNERINLKEKQIKTICVIGDGYGFMTSLLKSIIPEVRVVNVNLGRTLFFDMFFTLKSFNNDKMALISSDEEKLSLIEEKEILFLEAENYEWLRDLPIDLFINIASMQEMNPPIINDYFTHMSQSTAPKIYFYCCNRLEKQLPDGTITKFYDYPWGDSTVLLDGACPWYQKFPISKPPFWRNFDGPIFHRFVILSKK